MVYDKLVEAVTARMHFSSPLADVLRSLACGELGPITIYGVKVLREGDKCV